MAKSKPAKTPQTPRQIRRQQQRQAAALDYASPATIPPSQSLVDLLGPGVLVPVYISMMIVGCTLFYTKGFASPKGNEFSIHLSLFTAVNAATLTGFRQARNPDDYTGAGQLLTFMLMLGGMLFSFICGGLAVVRIARMRFRDIEVVKRTFGAIAIAGIVGGLALLGEGRTLNECTFQAISAFGNSGLTLGPFTSMDGVRATLVLLPLALLGGLGLPVLMDVVDRLRGKGPMTEHTRTVLNWTAGSYLVLALGLFLLRANELHATVESVRDHFVDASQMAINARSAGFPFQFASRLPQAIPFVLVLVMLIGASPGGTAGGIKVTTLAVLTRGTRDSLRGKTPGRPFAAALIWTAIYLAILAASTTGLLMSVPDIHLDRTLFLAASALGNVGLSYDPVDVSTAGLYVLSITMLLGKIAPVVMLWYVADTTPDATIATG